MDVEGKNIWQVAAGDKDRDYYVDLCLDWDVILWGPGSYAPRPDCKPELRSNRPGQLPIGQRFCEKIADGDLVVLRMGTSEIYRALGWAPQKMAVEWKGVDIALFDRMPRKDNNLVVVVEAKKRDSSCLTAKSQAEEYAKKPGGNEVNALL